MASCDVDYDDCDGDPVTGCETNLQIDPAHCNDCMGLCPTTGTNTPTCTNGVCGESTCLAGTADCDGNAGNGCETDVTTSDQHCGFCSNACALPNAVASCASGVCTLSVCTSPFQDCDTQSGNGCEADPTAQNALHCGACGRACSRAHASSVACSAGACSAVCDTGFDDCQTPSNPDADDGCERPTAADPSNCGGCNVVCNLPNAAAGCAAGKCTVASCDADHGNCDAVASNGCESDVLADEANCGACGRDCDATNVATENCTGGRCLSSCKSGFGNCQQPAAPAPDDGCESTLASDPQNCGGCGRPCSTAGVASLSCASGLCTSSCALGFANCATPSAPTDDDGCEVDANTDDQHCGSCSNDCTQQGGGGKLQCGAPENGRCGCGGDALRCQQLGSGGSCDSSGLCVCTSGTCRPGEACLPFAPFLDTCSCNGGGACLFAGEVCCQNPAGCRNIDADPASCGACGHACPPGFGCAGGNCECSGDPSCNAGSAGLCAGSGRCQCGATTCQPGERCQAGEMCG